MFPPESFNGTIQSEVENDDQDSTISDLSGLSDFSNLSNQDFKPDGKSIYFYSL